MAIEFTYKIDDDLLRVTTTGYDETLDDALNYASELIKIGVENKVKRALINEHNLEYRLSTLDTFKLADYISQTAPKIGKLALVFNPKYINDVSFWETVVVNRGLTIKIFPDEEKAIKWLS